MVLLLDLWSYLGILFLSEVQIYLTVNIFLGFETRNKNRKHGWGHGDQPRSQFISHITPLSLFTELNTVVNLLCMLTVIFMQTQDIYIQGSLLSKLFWALLLSLNKK